jgi:hypothetical protein
MRQLVIVGAAALFIVVFVTAGGSAQEQTWRGQNLQVFPADISRPELIERMREFSFALGVRCQHCHAGGDGVSFDGVVFESDDKPAKRTARSMLRMVATLNESILPTIEQREDPPVQMSCAICHRGLPRPKTLATELTGVIDREGIGAAVARYRDLRENALLLGLFAFDEWTMNELGRELGEAGKLDAAIAMLELNAEYYPASTAIDQQLAELFLLQGDRPKAIAQLEAALVKEPDNAGIKRRLAEIRGG